MYHALRDLKGLVAVFVLIMAPAAGAAQEPAVDSATAEAAAEERAVLAAAQALLEIINARDSVSARQLLVPQGALMAVVPAEGGGRLQVTPHETFIRTIGEAGTSLQERMWDPEVRIRGPIATVWAPYDFYIDGAFSHCGIDAFSLVKTAGEWKVAGVIYTVEREDCPGTPPDAPRP